MSSYHFVGIGGAGLAPIARYLIEKGHQVSGSDLHATTITQELEKIGVKISIGHQRNNITNAERIIRSSAIPDSNIEVQSAIEIGIPVLKRKDFLGELTLDKDVIAVAGTHGKTTTTAMLAWCLTKLNTDPSFIIGGVSKNLGTNAHAGHGKYFVIEADEYDHMFLGLRPKIMVITNIEHDHPDLYPTKQHYFEAFQEFSHLIQDNGILITCRDDVGADNIYHSLLGNVRKYSYGTESSSHYLISNIHHDPGCGVSFTINNLQGIRSTHSYDLQLLIPGKHNALNAGAALAVIHQMGLQVDKAVQALSAYSGTGRRFDIKGEYKGITVIDDYAHHPSEIRATLSAARCRYPNQRIWCVWQPHTFSRTKQLINEFATAFNDCNYVIVSEIFASREEKEDFSSQSIVPLLNHQNVCFIADLKEIASYLIQNLVEGDVVLVLSAGDADQISQDVLNHFGKKGLPHA